jgi:putative transcriptional regulator
LNDCLDNPGMTAKPDLRLRLKADGRIVEVCPDGSERTVSESSLFPQFKAIAAPGPAGGDAAYARAIRAAARMTQSEFAARIGVPVETVRNWEQGKRSPRGPARALLRVIEGAPDVAFQVLGKKH